MLFSTTTTTEIFLAVAIATAALGACARPTKTLPPKAATPQPKSLAAAVRPPLLAALPEIIATATTLEGLCVAGATERCNGYDDNCDGSIDEGCGYSTGAIQVTVAWAGNVDIDLYLSDPVGETISHQHERSASGGLFDHEGRGACDDQSLPANVENIRWTENAPPKGRYVIELHYWGECNSNAGPVSVIGSIAVASKVVSAFRFMLSPNQRVEVASFRLR